MLHIYNTIIEHSPYKPKRIGRMTYKRKEDLAEFTINSYAK